MSDRQVKVSLVLAAQGYIAGMENASRKTRETGTEMEKLAAQRQSFETLGRSAIAFGAAVGIGVGLAVKKWADFDQQMSYVQAATHETAANMDLLRQAALDAGARTVYSATEAAQAIEELARAGVSTADILAGGLDASLDLAAAGGLQVADAAGIAAVALKTFNLHGSDMSHVADLLAAGAGKAMGDVSQLSQALAQGGQVAKQTGLSIEETTAGLAAFAAQGLLGSDAGTSFKSMLQRLTPQSAEAERAMKELGISAYDSSGQFIGLAKFAGNLRTALKDLTPEQRNAALATIFGSDAVRAASVLYDEGADGIQKWISAVNDQGYAAETARIRLDNLKGDVEALSGAFDTALITSGSGANDMLRMLVQTATNAIDAYNDLPDVLQGGILATAAIAAGIALVGGTALIAVPKVAEFKAAVAALGFEGNAVTGKLGLLTKAAGGVVTGFALGVAGADLLTTALNNLGDAAEVTENKLATAKTGADVLRSAFGSGFTGALSGGEMRDAAGSLEHLGDALDRVASGASGLKGSAKDALAMSDALLAVTKLGPELGKLAGTNLPLAQEQFRSLTESAHLNGTQIGLLLDQMGDYKSALTKAATEQGLTADSATLVGLALGDVAPAAETAGAGITATGTTASDAKEKLDELTDALKNVAGAALELGASHDQALSAINAMRDAAAAENVSLDGTNDASIRFRNSLRDVEQAHRDSAQAILENGGTLEAAQGEWQNGRQSVIDMLTAILGSTDAAVAWADTNLGTSAAVTNALTGVKNAVDAIPPGKNIKVNADTADAEAAINWVTRDRAVYVTLNTGDVRDVFGHGTQLANQTGGFYTQGVKAFAAGGFASGIYNGRSGAIHKFAEPWLPWETYISPDPANRDKNLGIWEETGRRLGAWEPAPAMNALGGGLGGPLIEIRQEFPGNFYSYDPTDVARESKERMNRALAAYGL